MSETLILLNRSEETIEAIDQRVSTIEALGSLSTDAELIAAVASILGSADSSGDTLGELEALISARLVKANNLSDLTDVSAALTNLGFSTFAKTLRSAVDAAAFRTAVGSRVNDTGGLELGYAERLSNDTTTNGTIGNATLVANRISGLAITVVGTGRPTLIEFHCGGIYNSTVNSYAGAVLLQDGVQIMAGTALSPSNSVGQTFTLKARKVLTQGVSYTFEVGKYGQGGTTTFVGAAAYPMYLSAEGR